MMGEKKRLDSGLKWDMVAKQMQECPDSGRISWNWKRWTKGNSNDEMTSLSGKPIATTTCWLTGKLTEAYKMIKSIL